MPYHISRNGQTYGPYTLDDLERYVASGHVLLTDLCRADEDPAVQPVADVLRAAGRTPAPPPGAYQPVAGAPAYTAPAYTAPAYTASPAYAPAAFPAPPNLHWGLVLLFDVLTCSIFQIVWNIIMSAWFRRVAPPSKALWFYIASAVLLLIQGIVGQSAGLLSGRHSMVYGSPLAYHAFSGAFASYGLVALVCWIVRLVARFTFRNELEQHFNTVDPIGLRVNPVLTFFFGGIYLQSVLNRINETRRLQAYGVLPR